MAKVNNWEIKKNIYDLRYQRCLSEHNVWMASSLLLSFSVIGILYEAMAVKNSFALMGIGFLVFLLAHSKKTVLDRKLDKITAEIEQLN